MGKCLYAILWLSLLCSCGGGGNGSLVGEDIDPALLYTWEQDVFYPAHYYKNKCADPRSGLDTFNNNQPFPDEQGDYIDENFWLRSWINELYLWYDEVEDVDPYAYENPVKYFDELKTEGTTPAGSLKDDFHFTWNTFDYRSATYSGVSFGYGISYAHLDSEDNQEIRVLDVAPNSPADNANIRRGMRITAVDGYDTVNGGFTQPVADGLYPSAEGETHVLSVQAIGATESSEVQLTSGTFSDVVVKYIDTIETQTGLVGYMFFKSFNVPAELALFQAFKNLQEAGIDDLVLDMRYNGGGLLDVAAETAFMIAGEARTANHVFFQHRFNDQYSDRNPVTGQALNPIYFHSEARGYSVASGIALPQLNLPRVFILSTGGTCSASEAVINGLRGIGVEVILIGDTTCGKPYGFYPEDNCGTTYFAIQFAGVNDLGFGEYSSGFSPSNEPGFIGTEVPGCWVQDDFTKLLGDPEEAMLAAALQYRANGTCPQVAVSVKPSQLLQQKRQQEKITVPDEFNKMILVPEWRRY